MKKNILLIISIIISGFSWGQENNMSEGPFNQLIIRGVTLINGNGSPPRGPVDIVVEDDRIVSIRSVGYPGVEIDERRRPKLNYNGREIAENIQKIWNKKYKSEITYVKGDEWHAGNLSYHLESRPKWLAIDNEKIIRSKEIMLPNEIKIPVRLYGPE